MGGKSWPLQSLCRVPCRTVPQTDSRCPSPTSEEMLLPNPSGKSLNYFCFFYSTSILARMPESQRSLRMTDIYCNFKENLSLWSEKHLQNTDSRENDTSSNETESVVSEDEYIKQFVLGMVYSFPEI